MNPPPSEDPFADVAPVVEMPPPNLFINPEDMVVAHSEADKHLSAADIVNMFAAPAAVNPDAYVMSPLDKPLGVDLSPSDLSILSAVVTPPEVN